jgi:hypothetical protein
MSPFAWQVAIADGPLRDARYEAAEIQLVDDGRAAYFMLYWRAPNGVVLAARTARVELDDARQTSLQLHLQHADPADGDAMEAFLWLRRQHEGGGDVPSLRTVMREVAVTHAKLLMVVTRAALRAAATPGATGIGDAPLVAARP